MSRNLWLTIALVLGAAAIWWAVLWSPAARDPEEPVATTPLTAPASVPTPPPPAPRAEAPTAPPVNAPSADPPPSAEQEATPPAPEQIPAPERTGPVEELEAAFASEPRDSNATEPETVIRAAFRRPEVPNGLLRSVLCRASVCKVETRWTPARAAGFMGAFMNLVASPDGAAGRKFDPELAISPQGTPDTNGEISIDVYLKRIDAAP